MTTTTLETASLDERGRLLHAGDVTAQLALAVTRLEAALAARGHLPAALTGLTVHTTRRAALLDVLDVLTERLSTTGAAPHLDVREVARLTHPGQLLALTATLTPGEDMTTFQTVHSTSAEAATLALRTAAPGCVVLPGEPAYDAARLPWNVAVDQRPAAVASPTTVNEVQAVVRAAAGLGLRVAPQSTGHGAGPLAGRLASSVLLRLDRLTGVEVDAERQVARVVGGTLWSDVVEAAAAHGLTALHGSAPDVAVAGYALSGGLSFYARQHGLASSSVVAVELVDARGELVRASADEHAELFWAVRGGGGAFGVVVALEIALLPVADVVAGMMLWPLERAPEVVRGWLAWTREVPESVTSSLRLMSFPPLPQLPPFLSGRRLVVVDGAVLESDERAAELLAPLRELAPEMDTFVRIPSAGLLAVHMDPPGPTPAVSAHAVLGELDDAAVEALLAEAGPGTTTSLMFAELRQLGGAVARPAAGGGATSHLPGEYAMFCVAVAPVPEAAAAGLADARATVAAMTPWHAGRRVLTFTEEAVDTSTAFDAATWDRLRAVRADVDPAGVFQANHDLL
ncbi:FAD-binding oxidoreductase [Nocardioides flavescens]|uniref:FAD-binding oxidoreductase n=1 Tax=Nocardioides flavescens TaxID=2691959 RepID=UPI00301CBEF0